jgi:Ca2+-dependent lipid-binding protein
MKRLHFASKRRPTIRKIASKILRVMRMSQQIVGSLSVQVRACTNLPVAAGEHRVDAYVMIQVVDRYGKIDRAHSKRKTLTVFNTCNPEFEEVFVYDFKTADDLDGFLRCTVVDYNASKTSTDIGFATIPLSTWIKEGIVNDKVLAKTEWHKLQRPEKAGKTGYLKSKTTGKGSKILISVSTTSSGVEDSEVAMAKAKLNSVR